MTGQQRGPVEPGSRPGPVPMDVDRAFQHLITPLSDRQSEALKTLKRVTDAARAYVRGQSPGRLEALAAALQEPVGDAVAPVDVDAVVQAYLTERNAVVVTREAAHRLGFLL